MEVYKPVTAWWHLALGFAPGMSIRWRTQLLLANVSLNNFDSLTVMTSAVDFKNNINFIYEKWLKLYKLFVLKEIHWQF